MLRREQIAAIYILKKKISNLLHSQRITEFRRRKKQTIATLSVEPLFGRRAGNVFDRAYNLQINVNLINGRQYTQ